jgi:hypothetical protein
MSNRLGGKQGTAYTGTNANQPPNVTFNDRPPTQYDTQNVSEGDFWLDFSAAGIDRVWVLVGLEGNMTSRGALAQWEKLAVGTVADTYQTDSGVAVPAADVLNIIAGNSALNCGSTVEFTGSGNTVLLNVSNLTSNNTIIGAASGNLAISGTHSVGLGIGVLPALTSGVQNLCLADASGQAMTTGSRNVLAGTSSGAAMTSSSECVGIGNGSLVSLVSGSENLALGYLSGSQYTSSESNNICIANLGTTGESNVIRIGTQGSGAGQQNTAFMAGIYGVTPTGSPIPVVINPSGQLGTGGTTPVPQVAFAAYQSATTSNVTGDGTFYTVIFDTKLFDVSTNYNSGTGMFTAPSDGTYHFESYVQTGNISDQVFTAINFVTTSFLYHGDLQTATGDKNGSSILHLQNSITIEMTAGDTCYVQISIGGGSGSKTVNVAGAAAPANPIVTYFGGYRIDVGNITVINPTTYDGNTGSATANGSGVVNVVGIGAVSTVASGNTVTISYSPTSSFTATWNAETNITGDGTVASLGATAAATVITNVGGNFFPGDGLGTGASYTVPVTGLYYFYMYTDFTVGVSATDGIDFSVGLAGGVGFNFSKGPTKNSCAGYANNSGDINVGGSCVIQVVATTVINFTVQSNGTSKNLSINTGTVGGYRVA